MVSLQEHASLVEQHAASKQRSRQCGWILSGIMLLYADKTTHYSYKKAHC